MSTSFESRPADWLELGEALAIVLGAASPLEREEVGLEACLGLALGEDVIAGATLPPWDNSAMDGYAARVADVRGASASSPVTLEVVGEVRAGSAARPGVGPGQAVRIMTGAPLPPGADCVVRVEDTDREREPGRVRIASDRGVGQNVRPAGQDVREGERVLAAGATLTPGAVGVLAAAGRGSVVVHRRPVVALLTTGDELRGPDRFDDVRAGRGVPDTNGPMLAAMVAEAGGCPLPLGNAADDPDALRERIEAGAGADVLVTVGGASMGEADLVKRVLDGLGYRHGFWRVRMRPGSPVGFGWLPRGGRLQPVFSLPGNPTSAFVTFEVLLRPFLRRLGGHSQVERRRVLCRAAEPLVTPADLTYFLRVEVGGAGPDLEARLTGPQGSGLVSGLARAGGLAVIAPETDRIEEGGPVTVLLTGAP
ncbi:MAG TPA: gephyrin-like molybdotransferase Glp [Longimicrobiales bacterium]|nr:gephyrin-like molybdotransferase Glp [Longimicrobiales bacterium]